MVEQEFNKMARAAHFENERHNRKIPLCFPVVKRLLNDFEISCSIIRVCGKLINLWAEPVPVEDSNQRLLTDSFADQNVRFKSRDQILKYIRTKENIPDIQTSKYVGCLNQRKEGLGLSNT